MLEALLGGEYEPGVKLLLTHEAGAAHLKFDSTSMPEDSAKPKEAEAATD